MGLKAIDVVEEREFRGVVERRGVERESKTAGEKNKGNNNNKLTFINCRKTSTSHLWWVVEG